MAKIKKIIKNFIPPIFYLVYNFFKKKENLNKAQEVWSGNYNSWAVANAQCSGYDNTYILDQCKKGLLKVKSGEAAYERDSVVFDEIQYSWGLLAGLQNAALENDGRLCVLDFGGSLGSSYYQNKVFLNTINDLKWCIVEQPHFVKCGQENFENEQLKFYHSIEECMAANKIDVLLLSGVLQYLEKPYEWIERLVSLKIPYIIIDRTAFADIEEDILTIQNVPEEIYKASYPCWFFNGKKVLQKMSAYLSLASFDSLCDRALIINSKFIANWKGYILKAK